MIRSNRSRALVALLAVLALIAAACGGGREDSSSDEENEAAAESTGDEAAEYLHVDDCEGDFTQGVTDDTIKIGSSFPQSGTFAAFAQISTGYQAYFDYVNEELGGIDGRQIEFIALDDGYEPGRTATNAQRLVQDEGVFALFNVIGTANNLAIWDNLEEECVPNLFAGTGAPQWGDPEHAWTIGSFPSYSLEAVMYARYLEENDPTAEVALLTQNDDFGRRLRRHVHRRPSRAPTSPWSPRRPTRSPTPTPPPRSPAWLPAGPMRWSSGPPPWPAPTPSTRSTAPTGSPRSSSPAPAPRPPWSAWPSPGPRTSIISVTAFKDPRDPQWADDEAMQLFLEKGAEYGGADIDLENSIVAYGWTMGALLVDTLTNAAELTRPAVMEQALSIDNLVTGLALPTSPFNTILGIDKYPEEVLQLMQYSEDLGYYEFLGEPQDFEGQTAEVTPEDLITS